MSNKFYAIAITATVYLCSVSINAQTPDMVLQDIKHYETTLDFQKYQNLAETIASLGLSSDIKTVIDQYFSTGKVLINKTDSDDEYFGLIKSLKSSIKLDLSVIPEYGEELYIEILTYEIRNKNYKLKEDLIRYIFELAKINTKYKKEVIACLNSEMQLAKTINNRESERFSDHAELALSHLRFESFSHGLTETEYFRIRNTSLDLLLEKYITNFTYSIRSPHASTLFPKVHKTIYIKAKIENFDELFTAYSSHGCDKNIRNILAAFVIMIYGKAIGEKKLIWWELLEAKITEAVENKAEQIFELECIVPGLTGYVKKYYDGKINNSSISEGILHSISNIVSLMLNSADPEINLLADEMLSEIDNDAFINQPG